MACREDIFNALFALAQNLTWGTPPRTFAYAQRRVKMWTDVPGQPAFCQAEHDEDIQQVTRQLPKRTLSASWMIYHSVGIDPDAIPATETNLILDAIDAVFPSDDPDQVQTLDGLVHYARISGKVFKDPGDLDGQALIIVPISILIP